MPKLSDRVHREPGGTDGEGREEKGREGWKEWGGGCGEDGHFLADCGDREAM